MPRRPLSERERKRKRKRERERERETDRERERDREREMVDMLEMKRRDPRKSHRRGRQTNGQTCVYTDR